MPFFLLQLAFPAIFPPFRCLNHLPLNQNTSYSILATFGENRIEGMKSKLAKLQSLPIGCYVDTSACSADECNERTIKFAQSFGFDVGEWEDELAETDEDYSQSLSELAGDAVNWLNEQESRPFLSWIHEDNSLFLVPDVDSAKEDVGFTSSRNQDYPPADYRGEWLHVSDHGNCTLYVRLEDGTDKEVWSCV